MISDKYSAENILANLKTRQIGCNLVYRGSASSTMDVALEQISRGAPAGTLVVAETQERGKGRLNRDWVSPQGGVYVSIILYPPAKLLNSLTMIASLAVCDCIEEVTGITAKIKWPNDILVGGKKVSGILACSGISPSKGVYAVVGIGVNADTEFKDRPEIEEISTSLTTVAGRKVSRLEVLLSLLNNFEQRCDKSFTGESQLGDWTEALVTLGQKVTVRTGEKIITGMAESVDKHGRLLLRLEDGELKVIPAGDVTLRA